MNSTVSHLFLLIQVFFVVQVEALCFYTIKIHMPPIMVSIGTRLAFIGIVSETYIDKSNSYLGLG